jgi:hypothetical protein
MASPFFSASAKILFYALLLVKNKKIGSAASKTSFNIFNTSEKHIFIFLFNLDRKRNKIFYNIFYKKHLN